MKSLIAGFGTTLFQRPPEWLRLLLGLARRGRGARLWGSQLLALNAAAAKEVLSRSEAFEAGPVYRPKMLQGEFLFSLDPSWPRYAADRGDLAALLVELKPAHDLRVAEACDLAAQRLQGATRVDLVRDLADPVIAAVVEQVFGITPPPAEVGRGIVPAGDASQRLALLIRRVAVVIVYGSPAPFGHQALADQASIALGNWLDTLIAERHAEQAAGVAPRPTVIDRLVARELASAGAFDAAQVRAKLAGLLFAASPALSKSFAHAMQVLLGRSLGGRQDEPLQRAVAAAADPSAAGPALVQRIVFEALRFNPTFAAVGRYCPRATTLQVGADTPLEVPGGSSVTALLGSAMFDHRTTPDPDSFAYQRPMASYLHFGYGAHQCLGQAWATTALTELALRALRLPGILSARAAPVAYDGVLVTGLPVTLRPAASATAAPEVS